MSYSKGFEPFVLQVPLGAVAATATKAGGTLPTGFTGEVIRAEFVDSTAITGDNTNRYSLQLNKGTIAAPQEISFVDFVASTNTTASVPFAFSLSGNGQSGSTTLSAAITTPTATSITVTSAASFPQSGQFRVKVDNEVLLVTAGAGTTTWTVTRGRDSTAAATHSNGATITLWHNQTTRRVAAADVIHVIATKNGTASNLSATAFVNVYIVPVQDTSNSDIF